MATLCRQTHILIFSSNGQQQFVSSLVLHLSISSSFAERGGNGKGNYRFLWLMQQQFKLHLRNYNDSREQQRAGGRNRASRVTLCHVLSSLCPSSACYVLQCSNSLSNAALSSALPSQGGRRKGGE